MICALSLAYPYCSKLSLCLCPFPQLTGSSCWAGGRVFLIPLWLAFTLGLSFLKVLLFFLNVGIIELKRNSLVLSLFGSIKDILLILLRMFRYRVSGFHLLTFHHVCVLEHLNSDGIFDDKLWNVITVHLKITPAHLSLLIIYCIGIIFCLRWKSLMSDCLCWNLGSATYHLCDLK